MTTVVVPYTQIAPGVAEALDATGAIWEPIDVSASDDMYWWLLNELWMEGQTFILVEHDVLVRPDSIRELEECSHNWCMFETPYFNGVHPGLGCVKFGSSLLSSVPNAPQLAGELYDGLHAPRHWCRLDAWLQFMVLPQQGQSRHIHRPSLGHWRPGADLRPRPSHHCYTDDEIDEVISSAVLGAP